jgi:sugar/nucleoside kinase (ribokinase family)
MSYHVYGVGNALLDIQYDVTEDFLKEHNIGKGLMTYTSHEDQDKIMHDIGDGQLRLVAPGGSVANSMIALSYFGGNGFFSCRVADDDAGKLYWSAMHEAGLSSNFDGSPMPEEGHTGRCVVQITPDADRTMLTYLGASAELNRDQIDLDALAKSQYFYIEGYLTTSPGALEAVIEAKAHAQKHGVKVAITLSDPAIVQQFRPQFEELIGDGVDLIFSNQQEALDYAQVSTLSEAEKMLKSITKSYVITVGAKGSIVYDDNERVMVPATEEKAIDTLGAGDMYAGAFLYGLTHGLNGEQAGYLANITSSKVVTMYGPRINKADTIALRQQLVDQYGRVLT